MAAVILVALLAAPTAAAEAEFPRRDRGYHTYPEMVEEIHRVAADHPDIVRLFSIGTSYQGRTLWAAEVSDRVGTNEGEPEVLFDGLHHGLEHMSAEMALALFHWLVDGYPGNARIRRIVDTRRVWIIFMLNPDGGQYDIRGGRYRDWRKNRQPNPGSRAVGTDLNRNYGFMWNCCGGSSSRASSSIYHGSRAWSAPEVRAYRDFMISRRDALGRQRIRISVSFHTSGRYILYPYGHTRVNVPPEMTSLDYRAMRTLARRMADTNGYAARQAADWYITDGTRGGWAYGNQRVFSYTFELTLGDHPPDEQIRRETGRNREAMLMLLELADCPYRVLGDGDSWCGPYFDDLEMPRGWEVNPRGTDTATSGVWRQGVPESGRYQVRRAASGRAVLVTGRVAGVDVDGGRTTVRSPAFRVPGGREARLALRYWVGLSGAASADDGLRIMVVEPDTGTVVAEVLTVSGDGSSQRPEWRSLVAPIAASASARRLAIELVAVDDPATDAVVEAGVDNPRVTLE
jgi:hypothetical protein